MIIMFDGPDNVGKSTQSKLLLRYMINKPTYIIHFSNIPSITPKQSRQYSELMYHDMFMLMLESDRQDRNLMFDRTHLGEFVYSPIYRNYSGEYVFRIERQFEKTGIFNKIILFTFIDEPENLIRRDDGKSFSIDIEKKKREIELFKEAHTRSLIERKYLININSEPIDYIQHMLVNIIFDGPSINTSIDN